jgi:ABC-type transport system involved in cytochrome bd biosynthesis fused ATPase/permease subunit
MVLAAFLVSLLLFLAAAAFTTVRGFGLYRHARRVGGAFETELSAFEERTARTEELLARAESSSRDLEAALARLRVSQARLQVLRSALESSQDRVRWLRAFLPL